MSTGRVAPSVEGGLRSAERTDWRKSCSSVVAGFPSETTRPPRSADGLAHRCAGGVGEAFAGELKLLPAGEEVLHVAFEDHLPVVEDADAVADVLHLVEEVGTEKDGLAHAAELEDEVPDLDRADGVHASRGLIEEKEAGVVHEGLGEADALEHALGVAGEAAMAMGLQAHEGEEFGDLLLEATAAHAAESPEETDGLLAREIAVKVGVLRQIADANAGGGALDAHPEDVGFALGGLVEPEDELERGAFSGAVGPEQAVDFVLAHGEVKAIESHDPAAPGRAKVLCEGACLNSVHGSPQNTVQPRGRQRRDAVKIYRD
jgi:hypothetical protein